MISLRFQHQLISPGQVGDRGVLAQRAVAEGDLKGSDHALVALVAREMELRQSCVTATHVQVCFI